MPGTKAGGLKAAQTNKLKTRIYVNGRWLKIKPGTMYSVIGQIGGELGTTGGFFDKELARRAGKLGGSISKRGPAKPKIDKRKRFIVF